ncbi:hypothetical protein WMF31_06695 [Sorangium sp. So ce1036]|uniref:hypothetical protein n=1 Tax=Sorangium sp. So ce1036 TaxID=3133328 RepID=UPI003F1033C0
MLKHLMIEEMVALLSPWVESAQRKRLFLSIPEIAGLHPKVVAAHEAVLAVRPSKVGPSGEMIALNDELARVDERHDHLARAVCWGIDAHRAQCLGEDPPDRERAALCDEVQSRLFPNGLTIVKASPTAEAGNTARVARLLVEEPSIGEFLKGIPARGKTTLLHTTQRWIAAGKELLTIEHRRNELAAKEKTAPVTRATVAAARSQWFRVVSAVLSNLELSDAPSEAIEMIRGPVLKASERAGKRYGGAPAGEAPRPEAPGAPAAEGNEDEREGTRAPWAASS